MTPQVKNFLLKHKDKLQGKVIEIGSLDVNGSAREIIDITVGVDIRKGEGVDLVCDVSELPKHFTQGYFDALVSTETLEHVEDWRSFVMISWGLVKKDGWLVMTMASQAKRRHAYPDDYWRMDEEMIRRIWPNCDYVELGKTSIGWVVQKSGEIGDLNFTPHVVP